MQHSGYNLKNEDNLNNEAESLNTEDDLKNKCK